MPIYSQKNLEGASSKFGIQDEIPSRTSIATNDYYANCIKENLEVGMSVRCRQSVQKLNINDTGIVTQIKLQNGLHDYNVEVILDGTRKINLIWYHFMLFIITSRFYGMGKTITGCGT